MKNKEKTDECATQVEYRKYLPSDCDTIRAIFKNEASYHGKNAGKRECVCYMFLDYYLKYEPDNVIVALDQGKVCGCIVGSTDVKKFTDKMKTEFLPKVAKVSKIWALFFRLCIRTNSKLDKCGGYGFHINIASGHQGKKIGTNLMQKAAENASIKGKKFMYLVTAGRKTVGYAFYSKLGFKEAKHMFGGSILMTFDL